MGWEAALLYIYTGCLAGLFAGLLGISGGVVTVPLLLASFSLLDFPIAEQMHVALGTSLASMVFNSLSSAISHYKKSGIVWRVVVWMIPGILVGSFLGALTAHLTSDEILQMLFGFFLLGLGVYFLKKYRLPEGEHRLPRNIVQSGIGVGIGYLSNILGIGGGVFLVPLLAYFRVPFTKAIGTSALLGGIISFIGALFYLYLGMQSSTYFPNSVGYLYIPAFLIISAVSFGMARVGAKLAHVWKAQILRRVFGCFLLTTGFSMLLQYLDLLKSP